MLMPASSEFVDLCRSQTTLLTQGLGASSSSIYLTEEFRDGTPINLIPVVVYPEEPGPWQAPVPLPPSQGSIPTAQSAEAIDRTSELPASLLKQQRLVLPLMDQETVLGLLVVSREDRQWNELEQVQLKQIANTLAIARVLDQRHQWLAHSRHHQWLLQAQQHDTLADLLHQFRNPLTTLRTLGKLLLRRLTPGDANREIATSVVRESEHLEELLQQFDTAIDWGEVELTSGWVSTKQLGGQAETLSLPSQLLPADMVGGELPLEACAVAQILEPLLVSASAIAQERSLVLSADIPYGLLPVQANAKALREVLHNLIDNALKYTPAGGEVLIQVWREPLAALGHQMIAIHDTGPGIPSNDLNHVFERHYRGAQAQTDIPGTGLGLAIAKALVQQMHGDIQAFSPAQYWPQIRLSNLGSTFIVSLLEAGANQS